jgi:hypothetical protein
MMNRNGANQRNDYMRTHGFEGIDNPSIDRLYGLEPVFEPGAHAALSTWADLTCPYCGERSGSSVDLTDQSRSYIEDCQVCCQPMQVQLRIDDSGRLPPDAWTIDPKSSATCLATNDSLRA